MLSESSGGRGEGRGMTRGVVKSASGRIIELSTKHRTPERVRASNYFLLSLGVSSQNPMRFDE